MPGVSVAVRSLSTFRATGHARSSRGGSGHAPQSRDRSQSSEVGAPAKHSTPTKSPDVTLQPKEEHAENMPSVPSAPRSLPFDTHELILMGGNDDVGAAGPSILLRACDVTEQNLKEIVDFVVKRLGAKVIRARCNVLGNGDERKQFVPTTYQQRRREKTIRTNNVLLGWEKALRRSYY